MEAGGGIDYLRQTTVFAALFDAMKFTMQKLPLRYTVHWYQLEGR